MTRIAVCIAALSGGFVVTAVATQPPAGPAQKAAPKALPKQSGPKTDDPVARGALA